MGRTRFFLVTRPPPWPRSITAAAGHFYIIQSALLFSQHLGNLFNFQDQRAFPSVVWSGAIFCEQIDLKK